MRKGWKTKSLAIVAKVGSGNSAPQKKEFFENGIYPFFRTSDVGIIKFGSLSKSRDLLTEGAVLKMKLQTSGTILLPKSGASTFLNHRVILKKNGYVSSHLATVKADNELLLDGFLFYFLVNVKAQDLIQDHAYPSLKLTDIKSIKTPVPPLEEQKEIVSILDDTFASIKKAKANIERNIENAKELFQSKLNEIFSQTKYALEKKLGDVCEKITDGSHNPPKNNNGNRIMISGRNITNSGLDLTKVRRISEEDFVKENKRTNLKAGDVLLTIVGTIGRSIVFPANVESLALQRSVAVFKLQEEINSYYLSYYFKSPLFQNLLNDNARGVAQRGVYLKTLRELPFYDNSLKSQNEIVETLDILDNHIQSILLTFEKELENLEELKKSILQKAFSGELTNKSVAA